MKSCFALVAVAGTVACAPSEVGLPASTSVRVQTSGTATITLDRLRLTALLRHRDGGFHILDDFALTSTGATVQLVLENPRETLQLIRNDPFGYILPTVEERLVASMVSFVLYDDRDDSQGFQNGAGISGPDRILGIDGNGPGYAWIPNLADQLSTVDPRSAEDFYASSEGRFTAFVPFERITRTIRPAGEPVGVDLTRFLVAATLLACPFNLSVGRPTPAQISLLIDDALNPELFCGIEFADCSTADLTQEQPTLPDDELNPLVNSLVQCRRRAALETLVIETRRSVCKPEACRCDERTTVTAAVTSTSSRPPWWPCGEALPFCDSELPLYRTDPACRTMDDEE